VVEGGGEILFVHVVYGEICLFDAIWVLDLYVDEANVHYFTHCFDKVYKNNTTNIRKYIKNKRYLK